jgi:hypothetical protein
MASLTRTFRAACIAAALPLLACPGGASATQERQARNPGEAALKAPQPGSPARLRSPAPQPRPPQLHLDPRHQHDRYYPRRGYVAPALPPGSAHITFQGRPYYFHGGVWFRPSGSGFVVVMPPVGIVLPLLPAVHVRLWIGGMPYYYANGIYYAAAPGPAYVVVAPPPGVEGARAERNTAAEPVIYPREGQSDEQTEADRLECNAWAEEQPGAAADPEVFMRAIEACMDGRGYSVR